MLKLILAFGICMGHIGHPDSLKFKLYYRDQCTDSVCTTSFYHFRKRDSKIIINPDPTTGICVLPSTGEYELLFLDIGYPLTYNYHGQPADTLDAPKLFFGVPTSTDSPLKSNYVNCQQTANGRLVDYFKKNVIRAKGKFRNGKLVGKITYYDLNGKVAGYEYGPNKTSFPKN